jgi:hypothetical protein
MRGGWAWGAVATALCALAALVASVVLGLEAVSWIAGIGSFTLAPLAVILGYRAIRPSHQETQRKSAVPRGVWNPVRVTDATPYIVGVHTAVPHGETGGENQPRYVPR